MYSQNFILTEALVRAHQDDLRRTAQDVRLGRVYSGTPGLLDHVLDRTGDVLIQLGMHLKQAHSVYQPPAALGSPFDPCEAKA